MRSFRVALRRRVGLGAALLWLAVGLAPAIARADVELRWKFKPGEVLNYVITQDMLQDMNVANMQIRVKAVQTMDMVWKVTDVAEDGTATVIQTIERVKADVTPPPGQPAMKFDSSDPEASENDEMLRPLIESFVGQPITVVITPRGEVKQVEFPEAMLAGAKKSALGQMGPFSEEGLRQMITRSMLGFPDSVAKGGTWNNSFDMENPVFGKQKTEMQYAYAGPVERDGRELEEIDVNLKMAFELKPDAQVNVEVKDQSTEGTILFDNAAGRIAESHVKSKMTLAIEVQGNKLEQGITTVMSMKPKAAAAEEKADKEAAKE